MEERLRELQRKKIPTMRFDGIEVLHVIDAPHISHFTEDICCLERVCKPTSASRARCDNTPSCSSGTSGVSLESSQIRQLFHRLQLSPRREHIPLPAPNIEAIDRLRKDFAKRHGKVPQSATRDADHSKHFYEDATNRVKQTATTRNVNDLAMHQRLHNTIDQGKKLTQDEARSLVYHLKEESLVRRARERDQLENKYLHSGKRRCASER